MTIKAMNWAWEQDLQPALKLVLLKLADRANDDGECWPGQASIATACGVSQRTLVRHIARLEELGLLKTEKRYGDDGRRATNVYRLDIDGRLSANLSLSLSDKSCTYYVPNVSLSIKEEPTVLNHKATADAVDHVPIVADAVRFDAGAWSVDDAVFDLWLKSYQNGRTLRDTEDWIEAELSKAAAWLIANPRKRKKKLLQFLNNWLTRASQPAPRRAPYQQRAYH